MSSATWSLVLGDSITRRMVAEYNQPEPADLAADRQQIVPINDFRTQRIDRIGGYGVLPGVNQGAPYQPLTSPTNEEVTYAITKRGGTEDVTLEMIANDDVRAISRIPIKLGLAAAKTVYQYVWNFITTGRHRHQLGRHDLRLDGAVHHRPRNYVNGGAGSALSQSALSAGSAADDLADRVRRHQQFIAPTPQYLVVVNDIEELAWQLVTPPWHCRPRRTPRRTRPARRTPRTCTRA
jgi:hypothetical protein